MRPIRTEGARPRPLILVDTIDVGGTGKGVLQLARGLRSRGVEALLANFRYPERPSAFSAAAREAGLPLVELEQSHRLDARCIAALAGACEEHGCNVLESHSFKAHVVAWRLRALTGRPWVAHAHGWTRESRRVRLYNALEARLLRRPEHVCVVSPHLERDVREAGRRGPITTLRNGIEPSPRARSVDERDGARAALGVGPTTCVLSVLGRLSHEKGVDVLLDALGRLPQGARDVQVYVAGHGPERARLEARAVAVGVSRRVHFLGQVSDSRALIAASDAVVMPSRSEGVPNVALEAVDAGIALVATTVGTLPEIVLDGVTGWLVPPEDPEALAIALTRVVALDPDVLARMGGRARPLVLPQFSAAQRVDRVLRIYDELLAPPMRDASPPAAGRPRARPSTRPVRPYDRAER